VKVLLRSMFPCPPVARWRRFETLLKECLWQLKHEVIELELDPLLPADPPEADFRIYAHKTKREVPHGDLFYKEMHMPGLFTIDHQGWGAEHSALRRSPNLSAIDTREAEALSLQLCRGFLSSGHSKHAQPPMTTIDLGVKPYLLTPLQLPTDDVIMHHSPVRVIDFFNIVADWAEKKGHNLVFKLHPGQAVPEIASAVAQRAATARHVFVMNENIHSLISESKGVIVINSGVGFESLIHGKPVVTMGACDYQWVTFRAAPGDLDKALAFMEGYSDEQRVNGYKFLYFYYHQHAYLTLQDTPDGLRQRLLQYLEQAIPK
jgi:Capsule polysaccharide biosynthesis protein